MTKKDALTSSKAAHHLITLKNYATTSTPVSQVGGLVEGLRLHGHLVPRILHPSIFFYGDSLKVECSYHIYLQMSLNSELELLAQLQK
jgi:hypothetical protein